MSIIANLGFVSRVVIDNSLLNTVYQASTHTQKSVAQCGATVALVSFATNVSLTEEGRDFHQMVYYLVLRVNIEVTSSFQRHITVNNIEPYLYKDAIVQISWCADLHWFGLDSDVKL